MVISLTRSSCALGILVPTSKLDPAWWTGSP
jgi:hypothetical protein